MKVEDLTEQQFEILSCSQVNEDARIHKLFERKQCIQMFFEQNINEHELQALYDAKMLESFRPFNQNTCWLVQLNERALELAWNIHLASHPMEEALRVGLTPLEAEVPLRVFTPDVIKSKFGVREVLMSHYTSAVTSYGTSFRSHSSEGFQTLRGQWASEETIDSLRDKGIIDTVEKRNNGWTWMSSKKQEAVKEWKMTFTDEGWELGKLMQPLSLILKLL